MIFTTYWFLIFAALVVVIFRLLPLPALRMWFLAAACLVFHAHFAGPAGMAPVMVMMAVTYGAGLSGKRWACALAMAFNVAALTFYKYTAFLLAAAVAPFFPEAAAAIQPRLDAVLPALPPLGVSFFAFEFIHYLVEVRRGGAPVRNPLKFLLFSVFFPSMVAGPIKRYPQFLASLEEACRRFDPADLAYGLRRIGIGFAKKVLIADNLTFFINHYHAQYAELGLAGRWMLVLAIGFRILMDFSGYSDLAIGFARLLGVKLPENFNWPYLARNIGEFWQRWHMSLSSWIRDYVYIPLGGNRHGHVRRVLNGLIAFGLCGLWHGPAWNFVVWGLYHGLGLAIAASYTKIPGLGTAIDRVTTKEPLIGWAATQLFVFIGWLWFFYPLPEAWTMLKLLFAP